MMDTSAVETVTESTELTSLFVGDLSIFCGESDMLKVFEPFGGLLDVKIMRCDETHKNLCYGFVKYDSQENAAKAMDALNGNLLCGRPMRISWAAHRSGGGNRPFTMQSKLSPDQQFANTSSVHVAYSTVKMDELITEASLRDVFSEYGEIHDITIKKYEMDPRHRLQRGYGFVHYPATEEGIEAAVRCAKELKDRTINGIHYKCDISHKLLRQLRNKEGGGGSGGSESMTTVEGSSSEAESNTPHSGGHSHPRMLPHRTSRNNLNFGSGYGSFRHANGSRSSEFFSSSQSSELMDTTMMPSVMNVQRSSSFDFDGSQHTGASVAGGAARYYHHHQGSVPSPVEYGTAAHAPQPFFLPFMYPPMIDANGVCYDPMTGQLLPAPPMGFYGYAPNGVPGMYPPPHHHIAQAQAQAQAHGQVAHQQQNVNGDNAGSEDKNAAAQGAVADGNNAESAEMAGQQALPQQYQYYFPNGHANMNQGQVGAGAHQYPQQQAAYVSEAQFVNVSGAGDKYYNGRTVNGNNAQQHQQPPQGYQPPPSSQNLPPLPALLWSGSEMIARQQQQHGAGYVYAGLMPGTPSMPMSMPPQSIPQNYTLTSAQVNIGRPVMATAVTGGASSAGRQQPYSVNSSVAPSLVTPGSSSAPVMCHMVFSPPNTAVATTGHVNGAGGGQPQWPRSAVVAAQQQQTGCA